LSAALAEALNPAVFWEYHAILLKGLAFNFYVFACAAAAALILGLGAALLRVNRWRALRWAGTLHVEIFRNAPDYVMVVWVHFVLPLLLGLAIGRRLEFPPFLSAVIALGLVYSGYFAETFRAGIQSIPLGQIEAGQFLPHSGIRFPQNGCVSCPYLGLCLGSQQLVEAKLIRRPGASDLDWLDQFDE